MERFGVHRSVDPAGVLPQQARVLDATSPVGPEEIGIDVDYLNIDSASWHQLRESTGGIPESMSERILQIVGERGKMQNPVTGSGGMLIGTVREIGAHRMEPKPGTRIATLVSLTLTPLQIEEIVSLDPHSEKVEVRGRAILFGSGIYSELPDDLDERVVLGILDVCGAPAWAAKLVRGGMKVVVIGAGGKSGMLTCAQAVRSVGPSNRTSPAQFDENALNPAKPGFGRVLGLCWPEDTLFAAKDAGAEPVAIDCTDPIAVADAVGESFEGAHADLVFVCANVPGCEGGAILAADDGGRIVFFSMATDFSTAALTAEGLGKSCTMIIGNGFVPGHASMALDLVRSDPVLLERFSR
jgi:L-erythro-3,5-diaminohexanoate dehydrogenase